MKRPAFPLSLDDVNALDRSGFVAAFGDVAEHSPWVAEAAADRRPFEDREDAIAAFEGAMREAPAERQLALIRAHPDLAGRAAIAGRMAEDSRREQAGAGLDRLTAEEFARFTELNDRYRRRFDFPFILAVKGATKEVILASFEARVGNHPKAEFETALTQIARIFRFRIEERIRPTSVREIGQRAAAMLDELGAISDDGERLTRLYLTPSHRRAADLVAGWMTRAGLTVTMDALGTVRGSLPPGRSGARSARRLLVGSHIDTVVDGGRFDGALGVIAGILAVEIMAARGERLPFSVDVLAFGDEEGVRFPTTLLSSSAVARRFDPASLQARDKAGVTVEAALRQFGCDPSGASQAAYAAEDVLGYLEVHIEQGPILEREGLALGVVTSIAGQSRFRAVVSGEAGHAGTVPMPLRRDALAAAAEMIGVIEAVAIAGGVDQLVATVGRIAVEPGAVNVIPARAEFTIDVRTASDPPREAAIAEIERRLHAIADRRGTGLVLDRYHDSPTTPCGTRLQEALSGAVAGLGLPVRKLASGAGHDGHAMHALTDIGMLFVRCRGGISHNPAEFAETEDIALAVLALADTIGLLGRDERRQGEGG